MFALTSRGKCILPFVVLCLIIDHPEASTNITFNQVESTFDEIHKSQTKLRHLIERLFFKQEPETKVQGKSPEVANVTAGCVCVPVYLCNDGVINSDGFRFEERINDERPVPKCPNLIDICCEEPTEVPIPESTCGYSGNNSKSEIRKQADMSYFGEFPWTAIILENSKNYECAGSLIHPQVVLTSAHCVNNSVNYTVRVGEWDLTNKGENLPFQSQRVQTIFRHPMFNRSNLHYDAALMLLPKPYKVADNVNTVCIKERSAHHMMPYYDNCVATGWGFDTPEGQFKKIMTRLEFTMVQHKYCEEQFRTMTHFGKWFKLHHSFICASGLGGYDVCKGYGGAPLVCSIPGSTNRYQLVGMTSWGIGCAGKTPAVFTRISDIKHWIDEVFEILNFSRDYEYESLKIIF